MLDMKKMKTFIAMNILLFIMSACGRPAQNENQISTAVAQTVQAQNSLTKVAKLPTLISVTPIETAVTSNGSATNTPSAVIGAPSCTVSARLASENPPDGALLKPGETFLKTWALENTGTCTWDASYKLIY